jgi:ABC-type lipoprotein release transport system permease subunit
MDNKAQIAMQLSEAWIGYSLDLQLKAGQARKIATGAWISILLGVVGLLYVTAYHNGSQMGTVRCMMSLEDEAHVAGRENAEAGHEREAERYSDPRTETRPPGRGLQTTRSIGQIRCSVPD